MMTTLQKPKLSVTVITLNEEENISRCLKSAVGFADEIVVVDSGSTDKTIGIAKKYGAKVFFKKFANYASQKNYALEKATGEWVLSLDGDETLSSRLTQEIKSSISKIEFDAYTIPRRNIIFGKFIRYSRWQPELDRHIWLWKKGKGKWVGNVHEEVVIKGKVGKLINPKIHYQYKTVRDFLTMMNDYSELEANQKVKNGVKFSTVRFLVDPLYNFLVRYFYRLGFLDNWRGFVLSYLMAIYQLVVWIKVWERRKVKS